MDIEIFGERFGLIDSAEAQLYGPDGTPYQTGAVLAPPPVRSIFHLGGRFQDVTCYRPDGSIRWVDNADNSVVAAARDDILNVYYRAGTPPATLYIGLVDNAAFTAFADADTLASHAGWAEFTAYTGTRGIWSAAASVSQSIANATQISYTITGAGTIRGLFLCNAASGTSGLLGSTAPLSGGNQPVSIADVLKVTYTMSCPAS